jgi:NRPS condensation-like uncharacterized protein
MTDRSVLQVPLNAIDEALAISEVPAEPWSVHLESRVGGQLDPDRLEAAIGAAIEKHPLARAHLVEQRGRLYWAVDPRPSAPALSVRRADDPGQLAGMRSTFLTEIVPLTASPPLRVCLVSTAMGDHVLLSIHHAASDGVGALRLLQSIARAYQGAPDSAYAGDALEEWRLKRIASHGHVDPVLAALVGIGRCAEGLIPAARAAPDGGTRRPGYGVQLRTTDLAPIVQSRVRHAVRATVNDVLLAALHRAVGRWNQSHAVASDRLSVMMPMNVRGPHQQPVLFGNFTLCDTVSTRAVERIDAAVTLQAVQRQTQRTKAFGAPLSDVISRAAGIPYWVAKRVPWLFGGPRIEGPGDCAVFSNLGRGDQALAGFGPDHAITGIWFSPPVASPVGVSLGVISHGDSVHFALRHRWTRLDEPAAGRLLDLIVSETSAVC